MILAAIFATEFSIGSYQELGITAALGFAAANSLEPLVGAALLRRFSRGPLDLSRRRDLASFILCAVCAGPVMGGLIGGTTIALSAEQPWWELALPFWAGDAMGVLTVGAAIVAWQGLRPSTWTMLLAVLGTGLVTATAFWPTVPVAYLAMLVLVWLAFQVNIAALFVAGLGMTLAANIVTALGRGPWAIIPATANVEVATLQLFLAIAIGSAWLLAVEIGERERAALAYLEERTSSIAMQRELLPKVAQSLLGVQIGVSYRPGDVHHEVGGDWYDAFSPGPGRISLVVGDIVGHDLNAAVIMGRAYTAVRLLAHSLPDEPGQLLTRLDQACTIIPEAAFSTIGYAEFNPASQTLRYACAGHPPPLLVDSEGARFLMDGRTGPLAISVESRSTGTVQLSSPSRLLWFTDGLVEQPGQPLMESLEQLRRLVAELDPAQSPLTWCEEVLATLSRSSPRQDDAVVLCADLSPVLALPRNSEPTSAASYQGPAIAP